MREPVKILSAVTNDRISKWGNRGKGKTDRHTEAYEQKMILSKRCFINVINPASQKDEEGLGLSSATIAGNKGPSTAPIRAIYQISCL